MKSSRFLNLLIMVALILGALSTSVGAAPAVQGTENQPEAACALLDNPNTRGLMSAMFETKLLITCGRTDELRGRRPASTTLEAPGGTLQTDVLVNNPLTDVGLSTTQSQTSIRVNPNTGTICSAHNDSQHWAVGGIGFHGFSSSTDGGATFVDHGPFPAGGGGNGFGDPSLAWRQADGFFYYAALHSSGLGLWRSTDDCETFSFLSMIHTGGGDDRELMAVDNNPASPYHGRIYVGWTDFAAGAQIYVTYSDDGLAWSAPLAVSAVGVDVQGAWPTVAPNGDVYVAWVRWNPYPTGPIDIEIVRSTNGGGSFSPVTNPLTGAVNPRDATATSNCGRPALNADIRHQPAPQIAVGPDGCLHVVYSYDPDGYDAGDVINVYYRRSCDNGANWGPEAQLNDDGTVTDQWFPTVSVGPSNVVVSTWYDRRLDPASNSAFDYYKAFSYDGGQTWGGNIRVSDVSSLVPSLNPNFDPIVAACYHGDYDQQVQDNAFVYIQWSDDRNIQNGHPDPDVWFEREPVLLESGTLTGLVYDANTMAPIPGAGVEAADGLTFYTVSGGGGIYSMIVAPDTYDVTGSAFGYLPNSIPGVVVAIDETKVQDIALTAAPSSVVDGYVTDADTGWPLYASINTNSPAGVVWTDPETGYYSVTLPDGMPFDFHVEAWVPGYMPEDRVVGPLSGDTTQNFALDADLAVCIAPGYEKIYTFFDDFESGYGNWTGTGLWNQENEADVCGSLVAPFPSSSNAIYYGQDGICTYDTGAGTSGELTVVSPVTLPGLGGTLEFASFEGTECGGDCGFDNRYVEISDDGGTTWNLLGEGDTEDIWYLKAFDLSAYGGDSVLFRFRFDSIDSIGNAYFGWMVDDVGVVTGCEPQAGGLVVGNVYDENTLDPLVGAKVENDTGGETYALATPGDPNVDDAFYTLFSPLGNHLFTASFVPPYGTDDETVTVVNGDTVGQDFYLPAPHLVLDPEKLEVWVLYETAVYAHATGLDLINDGALPLDFELVEVPSTLSVLSLGNATDDAPTSGIDSTDAAAFPVVPTPSSQTAGTGALLIQDVDAWGFPAITTILADNGIPYDVIGSAQIPTYDFSPYKMIIIPSVQGSAYNTIFNDNLAKFEGFVDVGGLMLMSFCEQSSYVPYRLPPFGGTNNYQTESDNHIVEPAHPIFAGVPNPYPGTSASHSYLTGLLPDDRVLVTGGGAPGGNVIMIERDAGLGMLVAGGQTFEFGWGNGQSAGLILENMIPYYYFNWEPDIPWFWENPDSGTVPAGDVQNVAVSFTALYPDLTPMPLGDYYATLEVRSNDAVSDTWHVPVIMHIVDRYTYCLPLIHKNYE
jgi:hypothetical protein